jgi:hypothetical protein
MKGLCIKRFQTDEEKVNIYALLKDQLWSFSYQITDKNRETYREKVQEFQLVFQLRLLLNAHRSLENRRKLKHHM